jgi:predicted DNA binding CopG/RHH family protein
MTAIHKDPIPQFKTVQEEAEFWDTHDTADYPEIWQPIEVKFRRKEKVVAVRFEQRTFSEIRQKALRLGIRPTTLVRMVMTQWLNSGKLA